MDSPLATQLFRQLFSSRAAGCLYRTRPLPASRSARPNQRHGTRTKTARATVHTRTYATSSRGVTANRKEQHWQQRTDVFPVERWEEFQGYSMVTAKDLRGHKQRPRRVRMLMRDFIEDSLYNPHYGYFSKQVVIFSPGKPFDFPLIRDEHAFQQILSERFTTFEDDLDRARPNGVPDITRQLWFTPTELFRPYYGYAIARYLVDNYKTTSSLYPYHDLIIYEMGAGRGTLMLNILDYIAAIDPDVYARTKYKVIEISSQLATLQSQTVRGSKTPPPPLDASPIDSATAALLQTSHASKVEIINRSIFDWTSPQPSPCFFLAFEVFDNFAHDCVRYDLSTSQALQAIVTIDDQGNFYDYYTPQLDPILRRYLHLRDRATGGDYPIPYKERGPARKWLRDNIWGRFAESNMSKPEYVPTRLMQFFEVLEEFFPRHKLVMSDFHSLPDAIVGLNAPVVQTRFERKPVPVSTPMVHQGFFDIMFPTNFASMEAMYQAITGKFTRRRTHEEFMRSWAYLDFCETQSGENPLLGWYKNASVMYTENSAHF